MNNILFDTSYIYREWEDSLQGKPVFIGDSWFDVLMHFHSGRTVYVESSDNFDFPFRVTVITDGGPPCYRFVYYDPDLEAKTALDKGKTVIAHYRYDSNTTEQVGLDWDWQAHEDYIDYYEIVTPSTTPKPNTLFDPSSSTLYGI